MSKAHIAKIVARTYLRPNTLNLLARYLKIDIQKSISESIIWVENAAGMRLSKIKPGIYDINKLRMLLSDNIPNLNTLKYMIYIRYGIEYNPISLNIGYEKKS
jgi:hypothetical protein